MATEDRAWTEHLGHYAFDFRSSDGKILVTLSGELDMAAAPYLRERLADAVADEPRRVRIDLTKVEFLGSTGVGLLLATRKRVGAYGGSFSLLCGSQLRRLLEISGVIEYLNVEPPPH